MRFSRKFIGIGLSGLLLLACSGCTKRNDLPEIKERGTLRVLSRNNHNCYFLYRGEERGFEYELAALFAERLGLKIEMVIPPKWDDLIPWLKEGRGDLIAASMVVTPKRSREISFTRPYDSVEQVVVVRHDNQELKTPEDLVKHKVWTRQGSSHYFQLMKLGREFRKGIKIMPLEGSLETQEILELVSNGEIDAAVANDNIAQVEVRFRPNLKIAFPISESRPLAWGVRKDCPRLLEAANQFWEETYRSAFYNILKRRYYVVSPTRYRSVQRQISPYDYLIQKYSDEYGLDWIIIAAQMYEESRFDPEALSWAGAQGLMQLMPSTSYAVGVTYPADPEDSIKGGVKYLDQLMKYSFPEVPEEERIKFALAAYNVGAEHVKDAQELARIQELEPLSWENGIEETLPLLSQQKYYQEAESGYCRCQSAVDYVNSIMDRTEVYRLLLEQEDSSRADSADAAGSQLSWKENLLSPFRK